MSGQLLHQWPVKPLSELCEDFKKDIVDGPFGSNLKREHYTEEGVPVLKIQNIKPFEIKLHKMDYVSEEKAEELKRHSFQKGDIIMTKLGNPLGVSAIVEELDEGIIVADLVRIRAQKINTKFLCYQLNSPKIKAHINSLQKGTTRPRVRITIVRDIPIVVPPMEEQQRIVSILDEAFHKISKSTETMDENLRNTLNLLISTREQCFTPKPHWLQSQLDELCNIKHGFAFKSQFFSQLGDFVLLTPGNFFETGGYRDRGEKQKFYTGEIPEGYVLTKGDLLVAMTEQAAGLLGSPIIVPEDDRFLHNQRLGLINWNGSQTMSNEFVYHFFNTHTVRQELHNTGTGIKVRHTSPTKIGNLKIAIPPTIEEQQEIADKLNSIEQEVRNLGLLYENKTAIMRQLKQSILQEAFNGTLRIAESLAGQS